MKKRNLVNQIRKEFPNLKWNVAQHNVEGWDHYVLILDNKYIFRFPRTKKYIKKLRNEIPLLRYLKTKLNLPTPQYKYISRDKTFAGYLMIGGNQLTKKLFDSLPSQSKRVIAKQIAIFLSRLHRISPRVGKQYGLKAENANVDYKKLFKNTRKFVMPRVSKKERIMIEVFLKEFKGYLSFPVKVITHSDFYHHHILLSKNRKQLSGIIDFGDISLNDPARDFTELWLYGRGFVEEVYKNYKGPKDKNFLKRSTLYYKRMPLWIMISRLQGYNGSLKSAHKMLKEIFSQHS